MQFETVTITPEIAESYLQHNINNRPLKPKTVEKFAFSLSQGQWVQNGDTIRFDLEGTLIDGQHRLKAVVKAQMPLVDQPVVRGLPLEAWRTIDDGTRRTDADVLARCGIKNAAGLAALAKVFMELEAGRTPFNAGRFVTKQNLETWVVPKEAQLSEIYLEATRATQLCNFNVTALGVMTYEITRKYGALTASDFMDGLVWGVPDGLANHDPRSMVTAWRRRGVARKKSVNLRMEPQLAVLVNAFNYWIHGKKLKSVHIPSMEPTKYPVLGKKPNSFDNLEDQITNV